MYKVSILVPVYGVEKYIERCARSLFEQTYQDLEFVFVNDCTPDRSIEVLEAVEKDYPQRENSIKIISHEKNKGLAASRNTGLDYSTGEFVVCVDSDDWLALDAIEQLIKKQMESGADMVSGDRLIHYEDKEELLSERKYKDREQMVLQMMQHTWDHFVTGRVFRRSLFVDNGLRWIEGYDVAEDRFMMTLLSYYSTVFGTVDKTIYHYERGNVNALTKTQDGRKVLKNKKQGNLRDLCLELSTYMVALGLDIDIEDARKLVIKNIDNGLAYNKFLEFIKAQGGNLDKLPKSKYTFKIRSNKDGYLTKLDALEIGKLSMHLGAGREKINDTIDYGAGIVIHKNINDKVKKGDVIMTLHTSRDLYIKDIQKEVFSISNEPKKDIKMIYKVIKGE